jgi:hypothetical protein
MRHCSEVGKALHQQEEHQPAKEARLSTILDRR